MMKIPAIGRAILPALALSMLLPACRKLNHDDAGADSTAARAKTDTTHADTARAATAPADTAASPAFAQSIPFTNDEQILFRLSSLCGARGAEASVARGRTKDSTILNFALKTMEDYAVFTNRVDRVAEEATINPAPAPDDSINESICLSLDTLQEAPDDRFDAVYLRKQVEELRATVADLKRIQGTAKLAAVRDLVGEIMARIESDLAAAEQLRGRVGR
jgi:hypothetical protein